MRVSVDKAEKLGTWEKKNHWAVRYFAQRYRGFPELCRELSDGRMEFSTGRLFGDCLDENEYEGSRSEAKAARQIKFTVELLCNDSFDETGRNNPTIQFIWTFNAGAVGAALRDDLGRLANGPEGEAAIPLVEVSRETVSPKGRTQRLSLWDATTIQDVERADTGRFVPPLEGQVPLRRRFEEALDDLCSKGVVKKAGATEIRSRFDAFMRCYSDAVRAWHGRDGVGLASPTLVQQVEAYASLLMTLREHADEDKARAMLWTLILRVGVVNIPNGTCAAIVTPWNPFRLVELHIKARHVAEYLARLLAAKESDFGDTDLFFQDMGNELSTVYYPEVCIGLQSELPTLLATVETVNDYSLAERPVRDQSAVPEEASDEAVEEAVASFGRITDDYLDLLPHERTNLCVVLYENDARALPQAVFDDFANRTDTNPELRCDLFVHHRNSVCLRHVYEQQNQAADNDPHLLFSSEAARNFVSRLRIGFLEEPPIPAKGVGRFADLVFMQNVVARKADVSWERAPYDPDADIYRHVPARWSRKRPMSLGDERSVVYLVAPRQPHVGQAYLDLLYGAVQGRPEAGAHYLPARRVSLQSPEVKDLYRRSHALGQWVVSIDELTDRRLLHNQGIKVIRYSRDRTTGRNRVVSTNASMLLLNTLVKRRLERLGIGEDVDIEPLTQRFVKEATDLSGHIIMRAARHGVYAGELIGLVLSKTLAREEISSTPYVAWYFLDDFADWFGQKEGHIADLLALSPQDTGGGPILKVIVTEAKYVGSVNHVEQARKSVRQLRDTVARLGQALSPERPRLDRDLWLARLADMMIEGMAPCAEQDAPHGWCLEEWAQAIRNDQVPIEILGHSHVFVSDGEIDVAETITLIKGADYCAQEVFPVSAVVKLIRAFAAHTPLQDRRAVSETAPVGIEAMRSKPRGDWAAEGKSAEPKPANRLSVNKEPTFETELPEGLAEEEGEISPEKPVDSISHVQVADKVGPAWAPAPLAAWIEARQSSTSVEQSEDKQWFEGIEKQLCRALMHYGLQAKVLGRRLTPNAALLRFQGSDKLTVSQVERHQMQFLTSYGLEVINVQPGKGEVVIVVKRPKREVLSLAEVWARREVNRQSDGSNLNLVIGARELDGELLYLNIGGEFADQAQHAPHTLIAGTTGSGKSVLVQNLILDICATNPPDLVRLYLIDPKMGLDYQWVKQLPHTEGDIITDRDVAVQTLEKLVQEMEDRYRILSARGASNLARYNSTVPKQQRLPVIFLVHDEFAEWMMVPEYREAVEIAVGRLGVKARAAGIYLIFVAQRPDSQVFPMHLRDNLGNRLVLRVSSVGTSEIALGQKGAERLLGKGHLAARLEGEPDIIYAQVPFLPSEQIGELVNVLSQK